MRARHFFAVGGVFERRIVQIVSETHCEKQRAPREQVQKQIKQVFKQNEMLVVNAPKRYHEHEGAHLARRIDVGADVDARTLHAHYDDAALRQARDHKHTSHDTLRHPALKGTSLDDCRAALAISAEEPFTLLQYLSAGNERQQEQKQQEQKQQEQKQQEQKQQEQQQQEQKQQEQQQQEQKQQEQKQQEQQQQEQKQQEQKQQEQRQQPYLSCSLMLCGSLSGGILRKRHATTLALYPSTCHNMPNPSRQDGTTTNTLAHQHVAQPSAD